MAYATKKELEAEIAQRQKGDGLRIKEIEAEEAKRLNLEARIARLEAASEGPAPEPEPEPAPVPTEKPVRIWAQLSDWRIRWPSRAAAITELDFEGRRALKMAVLATDGSPGVGTSEGTTRAQLETENFIPEGEEAWFRGRFYLPADFASKVGSWGVNVVEVYFEKGDGSPPWQIQARGSNLECRSLGGSTVFWSAPLSQFLGKWTTYAYGSKAGPNGWLEMHINDLSGITPAILRKSLPMGSFSGKERFIIQCYYALSLGNITLYHENEVVYGKTLASVR